MSLAGFSQYPSEHRSLARFLFGWSVITALEGVGALLWLALRPSEEQSRLFLNYSPQRWVVLFLTFVLFMGSLALLWGILSRPKKIAFWLNLSSQPGYASVLLVVVTLVFLLTGGMFVWLSREETFLPYYTRAFPLLLWFLAGAAQAWLFVVVAFRRLLIRAWTNFFPIEQQKRIFPIQAGTFLLPLLLALAALYLAAQAYMCIRVPEANLFADSEDYLYGASLPLDDAAFFSERRPWGILLIYKLLAGSLKAINLFQVALSAAAWLGLAWTLLYSLQNRWIKVLAYSATLAFSLTPAVQVWNHAVLSESLSISGMILLLTLFLRLHQRWRWRTFFLLMLVFVLWMSVRETHTYLGLLISGILLLVGLLRRTFRVYWLLMLCILIAFFVNQRLASAYRLPRWALPMAEVITMRILPEPEYLTFFARNGMPTPPELLALSGKWAISNDFAVINDPKLRKFSRWLFDDAPKVYVRFLLAHPAYLILSPWENIRRLLAADYFKIIPIENYFPALPPALNEWLYPIGWFGAYLWLCVLVIAAGLGLALFCRQGQYGLPLLFVLLSLPHLYLTWHGDALDVERHAALVNVQWHVGLILLALLLLDSAAKNAFSSIQTRR